MVVQVRSVNMLSSKCKDLKEKLKKDMKYLSNSNKWSERTNYWYFLGILLPLRNGFRENCTILKLLIMNFWTCGQHYYRRNRVSGVYFVSEDLASRKWPGRGRRTNDGVSTVTPTYQLTHSWYCPSTNIHYLTIWPRENVLYMFKELWWQM